MRRANETGGVIVNADSQQLYDGLRVLTARPTETDEATCPHRLYGVADPAESWSVGRWLQAVEKTLIQDDRPLIIVGGTGLYFHALLKGLAPVPPVDPSVREAIESEYLTLGESEVRARLSDIDPTAAARIESGDRQRLVRALAVARATGRALSDWQADASSPIVNLEDCELWVVERDRDELYARCDRRVDQMIVGGAVDEVRNLLARGLAPDLPAMRAVGVRELASHLRGDLSLEAAVDQIRLNTRHYAKRQLTWFRNQAPDWPRWTV